MNYQDWGLTFIVHNAPAGRFIGSRKYHGSAQSHYKLSFYWFSLVLWINHGDEDDW
jgi:hypothetical protein